MRASIAYRSASDHHFALAPTVCDSQRVGPSEGGSCKNLLEAVGNMPVDVKELHWCAP